MVEFKIKPLSVNQAWKGKRFRSDEYKHYQIMLKQLLLKTNIVLPNPPYRINLIFGFSSLSSDWDNPIKPFQDVIAAHYGFNDKLIKGGVVEVEQVKKGEEFIWFEIIEFKRMLCRK